ncbi:hypothetical protein UlMin_035544 [Ulmus minor]
MILFLIFVSIFLNQASPSSSMAEPVTFSFSAFNSESCSNGELICMGSASVANGYMSLTPEPRNDSSSLPFNKVGRVLYGQPVIAWPAIISTSFTVRIAPFPNASGSGDGMTFVFAQDSSPSPPGSFGSYLGLLDRSTQGGKVQQLAVELDTFMNEFDHDGNHIGIVTTDIVNPIATKSLNPTKIDLKSGRDINVKIDYDGWNQILSISIGYSENPLHSFLNHSIPISNFVPKSVYVGFTASTGTLPETHQVLNWVFTSVELPFSPRDKKEDEKFKTILIIVVPLCVGLSIGLTYGFQFLLRSLRGKERNEKEGDIENRSRTAANGPKLFSYRQLAKATNEFSKENLLGRGGFGSVYKGTLRDPPTTVAVKKISATSKQGEREYLAEIRTIGRLRHKNIVKLHGWCHEADNLLLVYEYMPNGSLDRFIGSRNQNQPVLNWQTRYKILTGLASSLLYLHEECGNPVVHRDVKPNNVMLDSDYAAHLGDFGLARMLQNDLTVTTVLAGTPGYLAPEVGFTGKATPESDVYSFGMVVIELLCGRRSRGVMEENSLVDYVWNLYGKGALIEGVDPLLGGEFEEEEVKRLFVVGLACLHPDSAFRPNIRRVVQTLINTNELLMELPETRPSVVSVSVCCSSSSMTDSRTL